MKACNIIERSERVERGGRTDLGVYVGEGRLSDVQSLQVAQVPAEEHPGLQAGEGGVSHVEHLGVGGRHARYRRVKPPRTVHSDLAGSPETLAVVRTPTSWAAHNH